MWKKCRKNKAEAEISRAKEDSIDNSALIAKSSNVIGISRQISVRFSSHISFFPFFLKKVMWVAVETPLKGGGGRGGAN